MDNVLLHHPTSITDAERAKLAAIQAKANGVDTTGLLPPRDKLPPLPEILYNMPGVLGQIQDYIHGTMLYRSKSLAGFQCFPAVTPIVAPNLTITSEDGLGFAEQYGVAGGTTVGKEAVAKAQSRMLFAATTSLAIEYSPPGSPQMMHQMLCQLVEERGHACLFIMADEIGDWFRDSGRDSHKGGMLSYQMKCYSKQCFGKVNVPRSLNTSLPDVECPRVSVYGTSTPSAFFGSFTAERARAGAYNRWVFFVCEERKLEKDYSEKSYEVPSDVADFIKHIGKLSDSFSGKVIFPERGSPDHNRYIELDKEYAESLKGTDDVIKNGLGTRIGEQAIRMAGVFALADGRQAINGDDLEKAFPLRRALYDRAAASVAIHGHLESDGSPTVSVLEVLKKALTRKEEILESRISCDHSSLWKELHVRDQQHIKDALVAGGYCQIDSARKKDKLISLVYQPK